jgi:hypothetical protein
MRPISAKAHIALFLTLDPLVATPVPQMGFPMRIAQSPMKMTRLRISIAFLYGRHNLAAGEVGVSVVLQTLSVRLDAGGAGKPGKVL